MELEVLKRFFSDQRGNLALTAAISLVPIFAAVGAAVDYSQISRHSANLQQALDAAALATGKKLGSLSNNEHLSAYSRKFFLANVGNINKDKITFNYNDANLANGSTIVLNATYNYAMLFGGFLGRDNYIMELESMVKAGNDTLEIALVLDNSGSMRNLRIATAKTAAISLVNQLHTAMAGSNHAEPVKFSLVPFAGHVNVGSTNKTAAWMDTTGAAPIHHENLNWRDNPGAVDQGDGRWKNASGSWLTRFSLFDDMSNTSWKGCVEARPHPYNTNDAEAVIGTPDTLYVPVFAPDEPDDYDGQYEQISQEVTTPGSSSGALYCNKRKKWKNQCRKWNDNYKGNYHYTGVAPNVDLANYKTNRKDRRKHADGTPYGGYEFAGTTTPGSTTTEIVNGDRIHEEEYYNNYLVDNNNMPAGMLPRDPALTGTGAEQNKRQDWTWKYLNQHSNTNDTWKGPNAGCTTNAITPLTTSKTTVLNAIDAMQADGSTNIPLGVAWGWRTLSSGAPYSQGRASGTQDNNKIMIVMTDGNNTYYTPQSFGGYLSHYNKSTYGSYGYTKSTTSYAKGRLFKGIETIPNPQHTGPHFQKAMDEHMLETCTNAKNDGIKIYSVAFNVSNGSSVKTMLEACASTNPKTSMKQYFDASGTEELLAAFSSIGSDISNLRLAK